MAFIVALANNFFWNRVWTFRAGDGHAGFQAARFVVVSLGAFGFNLLLLFGLVEFVGMASVPAQAIAIVAATPLNFLGNKLWSFKT
jgi:dolichol-phosphate mannosyltransferase